MVLLTLFWQTRGFLFKLPKEWENNVQVFEESLHKALKGQKTVISVVQGGRQVIFDGQKNLFEAMKEGGSVKHFIPSTFALDLFQPSGELAPSTLRLRCEFADYLSANKGDIKLWNSDTKSVRIWGDGNTKFDITTLEDTGKFNAEAILDPNVGEHFECNGESITLNELAERLENALGVEVKRNRLGTTEDLKAFVTRKLERNPDAHLPEQYLLPIVSGIGKLHNLQNSRYPNVKPKSLEQYVAEFNQVSLGSMRNPVYFGTIDRPKNM